MVSWSLVASMQAFLSGASSFYACRALLGVIEGGFIPDMVLYLSYWYTSEELPRYVELIPHPFFSVDMGLIQPLGLCVSHINSKSN